MGYNLNFIPSPKFFQKTKLKDDIKKFNRRIKLRSHFGISNNELHPFKTSNDTWEPKDIHHTVKTFIEKFTNEINISMEQESQKHKHIKNLSKKEDEALQALMQRNDIIICNADKGGSCVIIDVDDYIKEGERQLTDQSFYKVLPSDPTKMHNELVQNVIESLQKKHLLEKKTAEYLKIHNPRTPLLYLLPKIHKENNPGRPVVSSINCHTSKISEFVDYHLQPIVKSLPSYVKDTSDFLKKLRNLPKNLPKETFLVTMDVKSLYTNIPNIEGIEAVKEHISITDINLLKPAIVAFLQLILTLNNFTFNGTSYLQINGVSMGTKCAPTYANIFMASFEDKYIYPVINRKTLLYARYIDDIFLIWTDSQQNLHLFFETLNSAHPTIKFDCNYSTKNINFLDTNICITENDEIVTKIFKKPTDQQPLLHHKSYHPKSTKTSIAYSQALRIRKICSLDKDFEEGANHLTDKLDDRGYNKCDYMSSIEKARNTPRDSMLTTKEKAPLGKIPFITTFDKRIPKIKEHIDNCWDTLHVNNDISSKFPEKPMIAFRRNMNLKDLLGQTRLSNGKVLRGKQKRKGKCSPCFSRANNKCCRHVVSTSSFRSKCTNRKFDIFHNVSCKSSFIIYLVECRKCKNKQYIGKTWNQASTRIYGHRSDAKRKDSILIDRHFQEQDHNFDQHFKITIIEKIDKLNMDIESKKELLLKREDFWIRKLGTLAPNGFNEELNFPE